MSTEDATVTDNKSPGPTIVIQYGKPVHQPTMIKPGTKMMAERVPAAEAMVCPMLFSTTVWLAK